MPRQILDPDVAKVVGDSALLRNAMDRIRNDVPGYGNMSYTDMPLLDQAYKAAGRAEQGASDPVAAYNFGQVRQQFGNALGNANPDYQAALDNFAQHSKSLQAIEDGQSVFSRSGDETRQLVGNYPDPEDQQRFRLGAADTIAKQLTSGTPGANEALRLMGTGYRQQQIRPLFPDGPQGDATYQDFMNRAYSENLMAQSRNQALMGSATAQRQAQAGGGEGGGAGALADVLAGGAAMFTEPWAAAPLLTRGMGRSARGTEITAPAVQGAISQRLWSADPKVQQQALDDLRNYIGRPTISTVGAAAPSVAGLLAPTAFNWNLPPWQNR